MGCVAGVILYFLRGMWYAPKKERLMGGISLLKKRAPILGGNPLTIQAASPCGLDSSLSPIALLLQFAKKKEPSIKL
jgi:hypothetical protein